jgi:sulfide:quinone oxidoreductase
VPAPRKLTKDIWVGATPTADMLIQLSRFGLKSVINNQADDEEIRVLTSNECEETARRLGMGYAQAVVVDRYAVTEEEVVRFKKAYDELPKPVFVYCRAGFRAALIWALSQLEDREIDDLIEDVFDTGYDLTMVGRPQMEARLKGLKEQGS